MKMPQPIGPAWNLRLFRGVSLFAFVAVLLVAVGCLVTAHFLQAAMFAGSSVVFGLFWQSVRHLTLRLQRWSQRPGFRERVA